MDEFQNNPSPTSPKDLVTLLERFHSEAPDNALYTFLNENGEGQTIRVGQLREHALAAAAFLGEAGARPGELLLIALEHGYHVAAIFWGALYLGAIPSILAYFRPEFASQGYLQQLENLARFTEAPAIVCEPEYFAGLSDVNRLDTRLIPKPTLDRLTPRPDLSPHRPSDGDTAFIQFSSGTTGTPKGVVLTHAALINYLETSQQSMAITPSDVNVGWLPLFHDMGLITQVIQPVYSRTHSVILAASDWLRQPRLLFDAVHRFKGTTTWMPNFAFKFCLRHLNNSHMQGLDLSSWRLLGCGSEPVQMEALIAFADRFENYGFDRKALTVSYGLAEHVAGVTTSPLQTIPPVDWISDDGLQQMAAVPVEPGSPGSRAITSCGRPKPGVEIKISSPNGDLLEDRQVGEVLLRSPSLFQGYYRLPDETAAALQDGWLHTGDLGYLLDGELYICGRKKELIIVRGRNLLPHHLEEVAQKVLAKNMRYAVAFGIEDAESGTELPVLICELRDDHTAQTKAKWRLAIREGANQALQVHLEDIRFVEKNWIVKTTSGKINHADNREKYLREFSDGRVDYLSSLEQVTSGWSPTEAQLYRIWVELLKKADIDLHDNFFTLGGDSLMAAQMLLEIETQFGLHLPSSVFFESATINQIASIIEQGSADLPERIAVPIQPVSDENGRPIFFCVHALGGGVLGYWNFSQAVGKEQPFYGLQARGLSGDSPTDDRVDKMASRYIEAMMEVQPKGPYHIGGYCFGGVVAYEMAQQLAQAGEKVANLVVIDRYAPRVSSWQSVLVDELRRDYSFIRHFPKEFKNILALDTDQLRARLARVAKRIFKRIGQLFGRHTSLSLDDVLDPSNFSPARKKVNAAIIKAYQHYRPKPYTGGLTLIRTPRGFLDPDKAMGWDKLVSGKVSVHTISGTHETVLQPPYVEALAKELRALLA